MDYPIKNSVRHKKHLTEKFILKKIPKTIRFRGKIKITHKICATNYFFLTTFFAAGFLAATFFAGAFLATAFFAGAFFATTFLATGFLAATFFAGAFLATLQLFLQLVF